MTDDNKSYDQIIVETGRRVGKTEMTRQLQKMREEGFQEGLAKGRQEILDWLENAYIKDPGRPDRGTPRAEAILEMARDAAAHFMPLVGGKKPKRGRKK
jgi:hypothetical protein